jgi:hypothetical protein
MVVLVAVAGIDVSVAVGGSGVGDLVPFPRSTDKPQLNELSSMVVIDRV